MAGPFLQRRLRLASLVLCVVSLGCASGTKGEGDRESDQAAFVALLDRLAKNWNEGNALAASECFAADAVYVEPPQKQVYVGRDALYKFFGGAQGRPGAMTMTWHDVVFDPRQQLGAGEFTFSYGGRVHGVALIRVRDGRIAQWREYWYESELPWREFIAPEER